MHREKDTRPPLVVIDVKHNRYQRFVGKNRTDHVMTDTPLDRASIEQFRMDPNSMYEEDDRDDTA